MAHAAEISALVDKLINSLTNFTAENDGSKFKKAKLTATRGLKSTHFLRVNQFEVEERYDGLEEKFVVLNRDDLAQALKRGRRELNHAHTKWKPEILALLLHLSSRPVESTRTGSLDRLISPSSPAQLTWEEIIADDPLDEPGVWDDIDYGVASSDDEQVVPIKTKIVKQRAATTFLDDSVQPVTIALKVDAACLLDLQHKRYWQKLDDPLTTPRGNDCTITELQAVRETLHMLGGLPTSLYKAFDNEELIAPSSAWSLSHTSLAQFQSLLLDFSSLGNDLFRLRDWTCRSQSSPLLQTLQHAMSDRLNSFDRELVDLHASYVNPSTGATVSLQDTYNFLEERARALRLLSGIIVHMASLQSDHPYIFLEKLFSSIDLAQQLGDNLVHEELALVFFSCLATYIRPIRTWMETGGLGLSTDDFFIATKDVADREKASIWHDRFELRYDASGNVRLPEFLRPAVQKIFNAGKSVYFLSKLDPRPDRVLPAASDEPRLDYTTVCGSAEAASSSLQPFRQLFEHAFDKWTDSKLNSASLVLRVELYTTCGLWQLLDAIEYLYLCRDGHLFQTFAGRVFERLDRKLRTWNDAFVLGDIARSIFSEANAVESARIGVRLSPKRGAGRSVGDLGSFVIEYKMSWALLEIVQRRSIRVYQSVAQLIMRVYRAKFLLQDYKSLQIDFARRANDPSVQQALGLRQRLICFADTLRAYLTELAIPQETARMRATLRDAMDIDAMAVAHAEYVKRLESLCFLTKKLAPMRRAIMAILDMAAELCNVLRATPQQEAKGGHSRQSERQSGQRQTTRRSNRRRRENLRRTDALSSDDDEGESDVSESAEENETAQILDADTLMRRTNERFSSLMLFVGNTLNNMAKSNDEIEWAVLADRICWQAEVLSISDPGK